MPLPQSFSAIPTAPPRTLGSTRRTRTPTARKIEKKTKEDRICPNYPRRSVTRSRAPFPRRLHTIRYGRVCGRHTLSSAPKGTTSPEGGRPLVTKDIKKQNLCVLHVVFLQVSLGLFWRCSYNYHLYIIDIQAIRPCSDTILWYTSRAQMYRKRIHRTGRFRTEGNVMGRPTESRAAQKTRRKRKGVAEQL